MQPHDMEPFNCPITAADQAPEWATAACTLHAASITAGLFELCAALYLVYLPMRLTSSHGARSCRGKGKEKRKTASLGSQVPQPISAVGIRSHQHSRPSSNILTFCPSGDHRHQSSRSLPPTANLPGHTWLRGHHEGSFRSGSLWGRSFIAMLNCQALVGAAPVTPVMPLTRPCI